MNHPLSAGAALLKLRQAIRAVSNPHPAPAPDAEPPLSSAGFLEQEPDLAKEAGEYVRYSGWAASGHPVD